MSVSKRKRAICAAVGAAAALTIVAGVYLNGRRPSLRVLEDVIADALHVDARTVHPNMPPIDGRYPGAVLLHPIPDQIAEIRCVDQPKSDLTVQVIGDLGTVQTLSASALLSGDMRGLCGGSASSTSDVEVTVDLKNVRVYSVPLGRELKKDLMSDADVVSAERNQLKPEVIFRSYEATPTMIVHQRAGGSVESWSKAKDRLVRAGATSVAGSALQLVASRPVVVAYETISVSFVSHNFSAGIEDVTFSQAIESPNLSILDPVAFGLRRTEKPVKYAVCGTSQYHSQYFGNLDSVHPSMELASVTLETVGARSVTQSLPPEATHRPAMDTFLDKVVDEVRSEQPAALVLYYVGHAIARRGGHVYLVLGDYEGDLKEDIGEELMLGSPRAHADAPSSPMSGSNVGQLADVANAMQGEFPVETKGLYAVSEIHARLKRARIPFALIIDCCFSSSVMESLKNELGLARSGDSYRLNTERSEQYADALRQFGVAPYLHDLNPVVYSATPGSIAVEASNPAIRWDFAPHVGPLSARLFCAVQGSIRSQRPKSWGELLRGLADYSGVGIPASEGSITWSHFEAFEHIPSLISRALN